MAGNPALAPDKCHGGGLSRMTMSLHEKGAAAPAVSGNGCSSSFTHNRVSLDYAEIIAMVASDTC